MVTQRMRAPGAEGRLAVWTNGQLVGHWEATGAEHRFEYHPAWLATPAARPLSLSLPFTPGNAAHRGAAVRNFFDNLLPDSEAIRRRMQEKFATRSAGTFELLAAIGRDCVGAVQLLHEGAQPQGWDRIEAAALNEAGVERAIDNAVGAPRVLGQPNEDELRISIAGAQEKTALLWHRNRWNLPRGATPTTHILKLPLGLVGNMRADMTGSVENEWLCARLLQALGLNTASSEIASFGRHKALVVQRFDRLPSIGAQGQEWLARLPQEDFCQALGLPSSLKYEADGGPGVREMLRVLDGSRQAEADKLAFILALLAFWLLAATDGHAKNFSLHLERGGSYRLTPLYDVLSAWPIIGNGPNLVSARRARMAMALRGKNAHYLQFQVRTRHWEVLARQSGVPGAFERMAGLVLTVPQALQNVQAELPKGFPARVFEPIRDGVLAQAGRFVDELQ